MFDFLDKVGLRDVLEAIKDKIPTSLPANGGNADTVGGHTVGADVPADAVFTDTVTDVDSELSDTSENPVQNKAIKSAIDGCLPLSGGTMTGSIIMPKNDNMGIIPSTSNYGQIGSSTKKFYRMYATTFYGALSGNASTATALTSSAGSENIPVYFSNGKPVACNLNTINENLLINPDFKINQRGISGTFSDTGKYFVDRWRLVSGTVTVNADGTLTLNGTISQILENAVGTDVTASVSAGVAVYDDSTKTFTITGSGDVISWAKLERGSVATAFTAPDPATELLRCMRYYEVIMAANCDRGIPAVLAPFSLIAEIDIQFKVPKRAVPSLDSSSLRVVCSTSIGFAVCTASINTHASDAYGMSIVTSDAVLSELPSYLLGVTIDTLELHRALAVDAEIY